MMDTLQKNRLQELADNPIQWQCPLREYTSFGVGGPAEALVTVESSKELQQLIHFFAEENIAWRVIGRGTNILVKDSGFEGAALVLSGDFKKINVEEREHAVVIQAGAGHSLSKLSSMCLESGYTGLEFAIGIPGSVGGAVSMNAGAWGGSIADILLELELVTATTIENYQHEQLQFDYRTLIIPNREVYAITSATVVLQRKDPEEIRATCHDYLEKRRQTQPSGFGNAGSFFKNPQGDSAGRLIDLSGLKGVKVGDAEVSTKHANFIINRGRASAEDILQLMDLVIGKVYRQTGIRLEPEVKIW